MSWWPQSITRDGRALAGRFSSFAVLALFLASPFLAFLSAENELLDKWNTARTGGHGAGVLDNRTAEELPRLRSQNYVTFTRDDSFSAAIQSKSFWKKRRKKKSSIKSLKANKKINAQISGQMYGLLKSNGTGFWPKNNSFAIQPLVVASPQSGSYRTVCVRLCDGYFWPVSFSTSKRNFRADARTCESSCGSPTRLFYYPNPGAEPSAMVDLKGRPYNSLDTAWTYLDSYENSCKCRPQPWEAAPRSRHQRYAALQKKGKLKRYLAKLSRKERRRLKKLRNNAWTEVASQKEWEQLSKRDRQSGIVVVIAPSLTPRVKTKAVSIAATSVWQSGRKVLPRKRRSNKVMSLGQPTKVKKVRIVRRKKKRSWQNRVLNNER